MSGASLRLGPGKYSALENFYQYAKENQYILTIFCCLKQKPDEETFPIAGF